MMRGFGVLLAVLLSGTVFGLTTTGWATTGPPGVIFADDIYNGGYGSVAVRPDGSGFSSACGGDATHGGAPRRYLRAANGALFWSDETCVWQLLYSDPGIRAEFGRWAPNGARVAFNSSWDEVAADGTTVRRSGIRVGDVVGGPGLLTLLNVRLAVDGNASFNWAPDNATITFSRGNPPDVHVAYLDDADLAAVNLTKSPEIETYPSFSPDGSRIAFSKTVVVRGVPRADIFTMPVVVGGAATQVTSKSNTTASSNTQPTWSPDGAHLAFACMTNSVNTIVHVCRIDKGGATKAVDLTPKARAYFSVGGWRR